MKNYFNISKKKDLETFIKKEKFKKIFILAGNKSYKLSGIKETLEKSCKNKINKFYFKKNKIPEYSELLEIMTCLKKFSPDLIIAAGGGSVLDYAKVARVLQFEENLDKKISNSIYNLKDSKAKLLAIPTTAGSGAEVTSSAVIYINKIKYSIEGKLIKPNFFFLIPDFIAGASNKIKSSAGFDVISQSIESLLSKKSNKESVIYAKKSLEISLNYFLKFLKNPNYENTSAMSFASNLAGKAINISNTIAPHAVSYPFTSFFNISHGHAVSLTLNKFIKFNYENLNYSESNFDLKKRFDLLFEIAKVNNFKDFDLLIQNYKNAGKLESKFQKLGINIKDKIPLILSGTNPKRLLNNPIELDMQTVKKIIIS